ncbi:hypothetical protein SAMN05444410_11164 [Hydrobacter penzbergensis]|uniref:Uncharacterized protein n=1 Tax=Hydrobacter penzbergensis TaxID=1235997 RepID=A0A8X8IDZ2_9BACT|nr:hypothetical protein [Hydrobacter penzbergensis]SDX22847.1 hypothetical protein SAMN05444410_11164 [Hydrobacter penzbergensis]
MKRKFNVILKSEDYESSLKRRICIDIDTADQIRPYLLDENPDEAELIFEKILTLPKLYSDHYKKEYEKNGIVVSAFRFFNKRNTRIYCQEFSNEDGEFLIICSEIFFKKSQKNNKANKPIIEKIANYEYEYKP